MSVFNAIYCKRRLLYNTKPIAFNRKWNKELKKLNNQMKSTIFFKNTTPELILAFLFSASIYAFFLQIVLYSDKKKWEPLNEWEPLINCVILISVVNDQHYISVASKWSFTMTFKPTLLNAGPHYWMKTDLLFCLCLKPSRLLLFPIPNMPRPLAKFCKKNNNNNNKKQQTT